MFKFDIINETKYSNQKIKLKAYQTVWLTIK